MNDVNGLIYPMSIFFNIIGIAISRLIGLMSLFYAYLFPMLNDKSGEDVEFGLKDFNVFEVFKNHKEL